MARDALRRPMIVAAVEAVNPEGVRQSFARVTWEVEWRVGLFG